MLNAIIERKEQLIRKGKAYYYKEPEGDISGPICPNCYTRTNIVNFLTTGSNGAHCTICNNSYPDVDTTIKGKSSRIIK